MANILDILTRAQALRQETALNSITPDRAGGIMYDTLILINQMQLEGGSLLISKVYSSVAAMEADTTPTSDLTGRALRPGQLAVIVPSSSSSSDMGSVYRYNEPGSWTLCGKIGGLPMDTVPTEGSSNGITSGAVYQLQQEVTTDISQLASALYGDDKTISLFAGGSKLAINPAVEPGDTIVDFDEVDYVRLYETTSSTDYVEVQHSALPFRAEKRYEAALAYKGTGPTITIEIETDGDIDGLNAKVDDTTVFAREAAATSSSINVMVDVSAVPDGSQLKITIDTKAGSTNAQIDTMNANSQVMAHYGNIAQGDVYYLQKEAGVKYIRFYKGGASGNVLDFTIVKTHDAPIDTRDLAGYAFTPGSINLGDLVQGYYSAGALVNDGTWVSYPIQYNRGKTINIAGDFTIYYVQVNLWARDFATREQKDITAQMDIDLSGVFAWNIQFRRQDRAAIRPYDMRSVLTVTEVSGKLFSMPATKDELLRVVQNTSSPERGTAGYISPLFELPFYFHFRPDGFILDGQENRMMTDQSEAGIELAARLGFRAIEANVHVTSDGKFICMHGDGGAFGNTVVSLDSTSIASVQINTKTLAWIQENVRYNSDVAKYRTAPLTLDAFCAICKRLNLSAFVGTSQDGAITTAIDKMGDRLVLYGPNFNVRSAYKYFGAVYKFTNSTSFTLGDAIQEASRYGKPFIIGVGPELYAQLKTGNNLASFVAGMHELGHYVGGAYLDDATMLEALDYGFDCFASPSYVNGFADADHVFDLDGDASQFGGTGTITGGEASLSNGQTITCPGVVVPLGKGQLIIKFTGSLAINFGSVGSRTISSDGAKPVVVSDYFLRKNNGLTLTASGAVTIESLTYKTKLV